MKRAVLFILLINFVLCLSSCHSVSNDNEIINSDIDYATSDYSVISIESFDVSDETTKQQYDGVWYLSEWEIYPKYQMKEQEENLKDIYIKCPLVYEENADIVKVKVEFFVEEY